jgi:hypothetical protein
MNAPNSRNTQKPWPVGMRVVYVGAPRSRVMPGDAGTVESEFPRGVLVWLQGYLVQALTPANGVRMDRDGGLAGFAAKNPLPIEDPDPAAEETTSTDQVPAEEITE